MQRGASICCQLLLKPVVMTFRLLIILTVIFSLTNSSCKKLVENNGIVGSWKIVEQFDGYANGGNFQWNSVPSENAHILSFTAEGKYQKAEMINGVQSNCTGTYFLHPDNKLEINSTCNTVTERAFVSERTTTTLILDCSGIEGVIRYKYSASK